MMNPGKGAGPFYVMSTAHWMRAVPGRSSDLRQGYFLLLRATPQQGPSCEPPAASTRCSWGKELFSPKRGFWVVYPSIHHERGVAVFLCRVLSSAGPEQWSLMVRIYRGVLCVVVSEKERSRVLMTNAGKEEEDDIFKLGSEG